VQNGSFCAPSTLTLCDNITRIGNQSFGAPVLVKFCFVSHGCALARRLIQGRDFFTAFSVRDRQSSSPRFRGHRRPRFLRFATLPFTLVHGPSLTTCASQLSFYFVFILFHPAAARLTTRIRGTDNTRNRVVRVRLRKFILFRLHNSFRFLRIHAAGSLFVFRPSGTP
jgi:hypothetical protein